jgi:hypothetical protein
MDGIFTCSPFVSVASILGVYLAYGGRSNVREDRHPQPDLEDRHGSELRDFHRPTAASVLIADASGYAVSRTDSPMPGSQGSPGFNYHIDPVRLAESRPLMGVDRDVHPRELEEPPRRVIHELGVMENSIR